MWHNSTMSKRPPQPDAPAIARKVKAKLGVPVRKEENLPSPAVGATLAPKETLPATMTRAEKHESNLQWIKDKGWQAPLEFLLEVMNDTNQDKGTRIDAAKASIPYTNAKLQSVMMESPHDTVDAEIKQLFRDQLASIKDAGAPPPPTGA
jgi:hypothetical protein